MAGRPREQVADGSGQRFRVVVELGIDGDLRYLSHHDEIRMLVRALVRARWPLAYSQGYNPLPRVVLPLPRSVGTASACQWALIDLGEPRPAAELHEALAACVPVGVTVRRVIAPARRVTPHPRKVSYEIALEPAPAGSLRGRIEGLLAATVVTLERDCGPHKPTRQVDIRPYIESIVWEGGRLRTRLAYVQQRTARPMEILTALGLAAEGCTYDIRRTAVEWDIELTGPTQWPAAPERNEFGHEEDNGYRPSSQEDTQEETS